MEASKAADAGVAVRAEASGPVVGAGRAQEARLAGGGAGAGGKHGGWSLMLCPDLSKRRLIKSLRRFVAPFMRGHPATVAPVRSVPVSESWRFSLQAKSAEKLVLSGD